MTAASPGLLAQALIDWQRLAGRHDLPWQGTRDPYRIWVSEIMLQQTQVTAVREYYLRFMARFPDVASLAAADLETVLRHWSGLGYYARARHLHAAARVVMTAWGGQFPTDPQTLQSLPGIGRSTAAAIAAFSCGTPVPILDGNVKRVLARVFAVAGDPSERAVEQQLWGVAARELPAPGAGRIETYTQALMDLGATVCVRQRPRCEACPVADLCEARRQDRVAELPQPRRRPAQPLRHADWICLSQGESVLLAQRPATGLWGGLWALPELIAPTESPGARIDEAGVARWVEQAGLGPLQGQPVRRADLRHVFTHFRLQARIWQVERMGPPRAALPGLLWMSWSEALDAPLPRPVKRLLSAPRDSR